MSLNKVMLIGRLGQDPELKYTPGGAAVCNFSIATSESWTDKSGQKQEKTEWHRIVVWGKLAELCNQYLGKGRQGMPCPYSAAGEALRGHFALSKAYLKLRLIRGKTTG